MSVGQVTAGSLSSSEAAASTQFCCPETGQTHHVLVMRTAPHCAGGRGHDIFIWQVQMCTGSQAVTMIDSAAMTPCLNPHPRFSRTVLAWAYGLLILPSHSTFLPRCGESDLAIFVSPGSPGKPVAVTASTAIAVTMDKKTAIAAGRSLPSLCAPEARQGRVKVKIRHPATTGSPAHGLQWYHLLTLIFQGKCGMGGWSLPKPFVYKT